MRYLLLIAALMFGGYAWSQPAKGHAPESGGVAKHDPATSSHKANETKEAKGRAEEANAKASARIEAEQKEAEIKERQESRAEEDLEAQNAQARWAYYLLWVGGVTAIILIWQSLQFGAQLRQNKLAIEAATDAANAAKTSADAAAVSAMPYLIPVFSKIKRVPEGDEESHRPSLTMAFKNIGNSPAIFKKIGAKIYIVDGDRFTNAVPIEFQDLPQIYRSDAVPPNVIKGAKTWQFSIDVGADIISALRANAKDVNGFKRLYVRGYVIYEDVLSVEYTKTFLVKILSGVSYRAIGDKEYNDLKKREQKS